MGHPVGVPRGCATVSGGSAEPAESPQVSPEEAQAPSSGAARESIGCPEEAHAPRTARWLGGGPARLLGSPY